MSVPDGCRGLQGEGDLREPANREVFIAGVPIRRHRLVVGFRRASISLSPFLSEIGREASGRASVGGGEAKVNVGNNGRTIWAQVGDALLGGGSELHCAAQELAEYLVDILAWPDQMDLEDVVCLI